MTDPTLQDRLVMLVRELSFELESEVVGRFLAGGGTVTDLHPVQRRRFDRDMEPVNRARQFLRQWGLDK